MRHPKSPLRKDGTQRTIYTTREWKGYTRLKDRVDVHKLRLEDKDVAKYPDRAISSVTRYTGVFLEHYYAQRNSIIANFYFDNFQIDFEVLRNQEP